MGEQTSYIVFGLGPIGLEILRTAYNINPQSILGATDIDPEKVGKDIGSLLNIDSGSVYVVPSIEDIDTEGKSPVVIHATGSNLEQVWPQIKAILDQGYSVVSTCEQISYPWHRHPELSKEIDAYAKSKNLKVVGTGINPGFVMDSLAICFSTVLTDVSKVTAYRKVDVSKRRLPLQKKVGIGMKKAEFKELAANDKIGHVGLEESVRLVAYGLGWDLKSVENSIVPTLSEFDQEVSLTPLKKGDVNGLHQVSYGKTADGKEITLDLTMSVGVDQVDEIVLEGNTTQRLVIPGGIFGDTATAAMSINTAKQIDALDKAGLFTMADIGLPRNAFQTKNSVRI